MRKILIIITTAVCLSACSGRQGGQAGNAEREDKEAKQLLQGVWVNEEDGDVSFRVEGDTVYYPDSVSMPAYFRILGDSLELASVRYAIEKQTPSLFWFINQTGDLVKLMKNDDPQELSEFTRDTPEIITYTHQVKLDSVVVFKGDRYHWYIAINPTTYKVTRRTINDDGMEVENVYYDNIMHVSVFEGARQLFSSDFRKQMYKGLVPDNFLDCAIFTNIQYSKVDSQGLHFNATLCIPEGASCYLLENIVGFDGKLSTSLLEY